MLASDGAPDNQADQGFETTAPKQKNAPTDACDVGNGDDNIKKSSIATRGSFGHPDTCTCGHIAWGPRARHVVNSEASLTGYGSSDAWWIASLPTKLVVVFDVLILRLFASVIAVRMAVACLAF